MHYVFLFLSSIRVAVLGPEVISFTFLSLSKVVLSVGGKK